MITESAKVVAVNGDTITVEATIKSTCSTCQASSDCSTSTVAKAFAPKIQQLTLSTPVPVKLGDMVSLGIPEAGIVAASLLLYIVPLVTFIVCAFVLTQLVTSSGSSELVVLIGSIIATLASYVAVSRAIKRLDRKRFQPVVLSKINS